MSISVLQEVAHDPGNFGNVGLIAVTMSGITAGSAIHVVATTGYGAGTDFVSCVGTLNGSYGAVLDDTQDTGNGQRIGQWTFANSAGGSETVTVTLADALDGAVAVLIREIGSSSGAVDGHAASYQASPGTGSDAVTVSATNANQPALISAVCMDTTGGGTPTIGSTGWTTGITGWGFGGTALMRSESKRITATGSQSAKFNMPNTDSTLTVMAIFDEAAGGTDPMLVGQMCL